MSSRKKFKIAVLVLPVSLVLLTAVAALVVHTRSFNRLVLAQLIARIERSTGTRVEIQSLQLQWSPFTAELFGVVARGKERPNEPPLFQAEHLGVSLGLRSLLRREVNLYSITLVRPVLNARTDAAGNSNLPNPQPNSPSKFSMVVRHASVRDGVVRFNDQQIPLAAEIDDLNASVTYEPISGMYRGDASYRNGLLATARVNGMPHTARVQFAANRNVLDLERLEVKSGHSQVELTARISNFAEPNVVGRYRGQIEVSDLANILRNPSVPRGEVALSGSLQYRSDRNVTFVRALQIGGRLDTPQLAMRGQSVLATARDVHALYQLRDGNFTVPQLDATIFNGRLSARGALSDLDGVPKGRISADLGNLSLENLSDTVPNSARQNARLLGRMNLKGQAQWRKDISALRAQAHAEFSAPDTVPAQHARELPVNGIVNVSYDAPGKRASFGNSSLRVARTVLKLDGEISRTSQLDLDLTAPDLQELSGLISAFTRTQHRSTLSGSQEAAGADGFDLHGSASFSGQVTGAVENPNLKGHLFATNLQLQGSTWRALGFALNANSSGVHLQDGKLEGSQQGQVTFAGQAGLDRWSYLPGNPINLNAKLTRISAADLERLGTTRYPITGDLTGTIAISGSQLEPLGHGSLQLTKGSAWNEPIRVLKFDFDGSSGSVRSNAELQLAAGTINANLKYGPKNRDYELKLNTTELRLDQLQTIQQRGGNVAGLLTTSVTGQGSLNDPRLSATLEIPDLQIAGQRFARTKAQVEVAQQRANLSVYSSVEQGFVRANGAVDLKDQYQTKATVDLRALPVGALLASHSTRTGVAQDLQGFMEVHASLTGPLKDPSRLEGRMEIPRLNFAYRGIEIANDAPLRVRYQGGLATIEQARMRGTGTDLRLLGEVPVWAAAPLNASAKGEIDAKLLQLASPDIHSSGKVQFDLRAGGELRNPETQGTVRIVNTGLALEGAPMTISNMNGQLSIDGNRLQIDRLEAASGGGTLSANGSANYGKETNFALDLHAKEVRAVASGVRSSLNADLQLNGTPQKSDLKGQVVVNRLSFREGFDLSTFLSQFSDSAVSSPSSFASNMRLGITVQSSESLSLASSQISIAGSANLAVTGTAARPVILGRINLTEGELFFQSKRFEIQNGTIVFSNPARTEPVLNLYVKTEIEQYNITINFAGPFDRLKTNYTSDPSLPPLDIINLLAFGQTSAERASNGSAPASLGAQSVIAQGVAGQVSRQVQNLMGISQLTIDPTVGASRDPGAQIAVQQRVTGSILMTFSTDVTSTQRQTVQLQYQPKPQWKISVLRDQYGGYGFDVRLHKVF